MISNIGYWFLVKIVEGLSKVFGTLGSGWRNGLVNFMIKRAAKAMKTKTSADNDFLGFWVDFLKSDRLKEALKK